MNEIKLLSFIILTYKKFDGVYFTLESLFKQDYPRIELIFSDDGSDNYDEEIKKIKLFIAKKKGTNIEKVKYLHSIKNLGTVSNFNSALKVAEGNYIKALGAEDTLIDEHALTTYVHFLEKYDYQICFSKLRGITDNGLEISYLPSCEDDYNYLKRLSTNEILNKLYNRNFLPAPAWCAKRELFEQNGLFDERIRLIEDYPYWIHLCLNNIKFGFLDQCLINYKLSGVSSTGEYSTAFMDDMFKIYNLYIFPNDNRYGIFQKLYNELKKMGLNTYYVKSKWCSINRKEKICAYMKYGIFFMYIRVNNLKYIIKNKMYYVLGRKN